MAVGHAREHSPGQYRLPVHRASSRDDCERACGRDSQRVHGLADDVLTHHRSDRRQPVSAAGEWRTSRTLQMQVPHPAVAVDDLAEQQCAAVAEARDEPAELVTGVSLRRGCRAAREQRPDQQAQPLGGAQPGRVEPELGGQRIVDEDGLGVWCRLRLPGNRQLGKLPDEPALQRDAHLIQPTETAGSLRWRRLRS